MTPELVNHHPARILKHPPLFSFDEILRYESARTYTRLTDFNPPHPQEDERTHGLSSASPSGGLATNIPRFISLYVIVNLCKQKQYRFYAIFVGPLMVHRNRLTMTRGQLLIPHCASSSSHAKRTSKNIGGPYLRSLPVLDYPLFKFADFV